MGNAGKVMGLSEAVERYVHDGALISFGGFSATQCPMAAVHEIIRRKVRTFTLRHAPTARPWMN